jgi:glycine hydroxymethyltransferase
MVDMAHFSGLVAAGDEVHPSPINIADIVTSTTQKTLGGPRGGMILLGKNYEMEVPHPNRERDDYVPLHEAIDFAVFPGMQGGPLEHVIAAKAVAFREALNAEMTGPGQAFIDRQQLTLDSAKVWEKFFTDEGYDLVSGGTDTHLILLREPRGLSGIRASRAAGLVNMVTNRNSVPYDKRPPAVTSGLRIGTGAIAAREFTPDEALVVAETLDEVLTNVKFDGRTPLISDDIVERGLATVQGLCDDHIIYADELEVMKWVARELNINLN